jgi:four helix bundle protein
MTTLSEIKTFRDLIVWQRAMTLAKEVYKATSLMPDSERFGLTSQMRRAAVSIPSNIAEGYARQSRVEYIRFLKVSRGSLAELRTQVLLGRELGFLQTTDSLGPLLDETERLLAGLIRSLRELPERTRRDRIEEIQ